ncbi:MAG: hypothetical protein HYZ75_05560 [Elusimicrobia bacterium]|nr:hypothetical protein [Elusimicrobiota bacterium]
MKPLNALLALSLAILSAGPGATAALAQVVKAAPVAPVRVVPIAPLSLAPTAPGSLLSAPGLPTTPSPSLSAVPAVPVPTAVAAPSALAIAAPLALPAAADRALSRGSAASEVLRAAQRKPETALGTLSAGARGVSRAATGQRAAVLNSFFTGSGARGGASGVVDISEASDRRSPALVPFTLEGRAAAAVDSQRPLAERRAAVAALDRAALERVAAANPHGGPDDYEVHRAALKALAEVHGDVRSLRPVSRAHADAILAGLAAAKPELAVFDYDNTLEKTSRPASPETGAALKAASDAGVDVAILSDRNAVPDVGVSLPESLSGLSRAEKAALTVGGRSGGEMLVFDARGREALVEQLPPWTAAQRAAVADALEAVAGRFGAGEFEGEIGAISDFSFYQRLPLGTPDAALAEAAAFARAELAARGLKGVHVVSRHTLNPESDPPYISASMIDKSGGMALLRGRRAAYRRLKVIAPKLISARA